MNNIDWIGFIGVFQIFSLLPGASRSGATITAARFLNYNKVYLIIAFHKVVLGRYFRAVPIKDFFQRGNSRVAS